MVSLLGEEMHSDKPPRSARLQIIRRNGGRPSVKSTVRAVLSKLPAGPDFVASLISSTPACTRQIGMLGIIMGFWAHLRRRRELLYWKAILEAKEDGAMVHMPITPALRLPRSLPPQGSAVQHSIAAPDARASTRRHSFSFAWSRAVTRR